MIKKIVAILLFLLICQYGFTEIFSASLGTTLPGYPPETGSARFYTLYSFTYELSLTIFINFFGVGTSVKGYSLKVDVPSRNYNFSGNSIAVLFDFYWNFWNFSLNKSVYLSQILMISLGLPLYGRNQVEDDESNILSYNETYFHFSIGSRLKYFFYFSFIGLFVEYIFVPANFTSGILTYGISIRI